MATYYDHDLSLVHHRGFGFHADACAPGILKLLEAVRERDGVVLEIGCGSGLLTRYLVDAGHHVIATDASEAMLDLAREHAPGAAEIRRIALPDDPLPEVDAIVSVGHVVSYLPDEASLERALVNIARAVRPGGLFAIDIEDQEWADVRVDVPPSGRVGDDWAIILEYEIPGPGRFVRQMATFVRNDDGTWRRSDERHENVLIDTTSIPALLEAEGVDVDVRKSFGDETLPQGLRAVIGRR